MKGTVALGFSMAQCGGGHEARGLEGGAGGWTAGGTGDSLGRQGGELGEQGGDDGTDVGREGETHSPISTLHFHVIVIGGSDEMQPKT